MSGCAILGMELFLRRLRLLLFLDCSRDELLSLEVVFPTAWKMLLDYSSLTVDSALFLCLLMALLLKYSMLILKNLSLS